LIHIGFHLWRKALWRKALWEMQVHCRCKIQKSQSQNLPLVLWTLKVKSASQTGPKSNSSNNSMRTWKRTEKQTRFLS